MEENTNSNNGFNVETENDKNINSNNDEGRVVRTGKHVSALDQLVAGSNKEGDEEVSESVTKISAKGMFDPSGLLQMLKVEENSEIGRMSPKVADSFSSKRKDPARGSKKNPPIKSLKSPLNKQKYDSNHSDKKIDPQKSSILH